MKNRHRIATAFLSVWGALSLANSALGGGATVAYNDGDLFLGFRATAGTGASSDYLLDIGAPSQYTHSFTLNTTIPGFGNIQADLTSLFSTNYYTDGDVLYGIIGGNEGNDGSDPTDTDNTLYASNPKATSFVHKSNNQQAQVLTQIASLGGAYAGSTSTANSNLGVIQMVSSGDTYASYQPGVAGDTTSFNFFNPTIEAPVSSTLYLDKLVPTTATPGSQSVLGTFNISNAGIVTFTAASVPEPSTMALLGAGGLFLLVARRRSVKASA